MPTVIIDGQKVEVERDATVLDAAKKAGVWIPTLCYHPAVSISGSCRVCMVELDRGDWRQLITACNYPVRRDIVVYISSDRAERARRGVMELLLARSPESPELKELAERMGVKSTPYPTVTESQRSCILCGLCIAVCEDIIGKAAIGYAGRGVDRTVASPFRQPSEDCIGCGACAAVCPVGTIKVRVHEEQEEVEISPFKSRGKLLVCEQCRAPIVSTQVGEQALGKVEMNREEFRELMRLCPKCRRSKTAARLEAGNIDKQRGGRVVS
ncbi:MAG: (2Fe-2S)-binding protein [Planctomycetota bacterium]|nr:MAG: (2Fe-2S)-binding protein [Planctomycetota bacterium]